MSARGIATLILGALAGFTLAHGVEALLDAGRESKVRRSLNNAIVLSKALERYKADVGDYPPLTSDSRQLAKYLVPKYLPFIPTDEVDDSLIVAMRDGRAIVVGIGSRGFVVELGNVRMRRREPV